MYAFAINLARSLDRRAHITAELDLSGLDYELVPAVDGRALDLDDLNLVDPALVQRFGGEEGAPSTLLAGSVGCALSHLQVYRDIIDRGLDHALVVEEDVILPDGLAVVADSVAEYLTGAEVVLLSYDSPTPCRMSTAGAVLLPSGHHLALPIDIGQPRSAAAYVITREACERLAKTLVPIRVQADGWWLYYREGILDRVRCVTPMPVVKNPKLTSTIGSYSLADGMKAHLGTWLLRQRIPFLHQALSFRRERIYRRWGRSELVDVPFVERASRLD